MGKEAPQRQNLSELTYVPDYQTKEYWDRVENTLISQMGFSGLQASDFSRIITQNRDILAGIDAEKGMPQEDEDTLRSLARSVLLATGPLNRSDTRETLLPLVPLYMKTGMMDIEQILDSIQKNEFDVPLANYRDNRESSAKLTLRDEMTSILFEAGQISMASETSRQLGSKLLRLALSHSGEIDKRRLSNNFRAGTSLIMRRADTTFYVFHEVAKRGAVSRELEERYGQRQLENIDEYLDWLKYKPNNTGVAFEWIFMLGYRDFAYRHGYIDRLYVRSGAPREERPNFGGHSFDVVVTFDGHDEYYQCKVGAGKDETKEWLERDYAKPIKVVTAVHDVYPQSLENPDLLLRVFKQHAKTLKNNYSGRDKRAFDECDQYFFSQIAA